MRDLKEFRIKVISWGGDYNFLHRIKSVKNQNTIYSTNLTILRKT